MTDNGIDSDIVLIRSDRLYFPVLNKGLRM